MKKKKVFTAILLSILVTYTVCEVADKPNHLSAESFSEVTAGFKNPSARQADEPLRSKQRKLAVHTSPNTDSFTTDDERIELLDGRNLPASRNALKSLKWNSLVRHDDKTRRTMQKFAKRKSAKRHKVSVLPHGAKMRPLQSESKNGKDKDETVLKATYASYSTGEPYKTKINIPLKLTILPTEETVTTHKVDTTDSKSDWFSEDNTIDKDGEESSDSDDDKEDSLPNSKPKVTGHEEATQHGGTSAITQHKVAVHPGMKTSSGLRWNVAHEHAKLDVSGKDKHFKKKKQKSDYRTEDSAEKHSSAAIVAGILAGILMLWFIFSCGPRIWSIIKGLLRWRRRHCREFGINFPSTGYLSEELSEEEVIFDRSTIGRNKKSSMNFGPRSSPNTFTTTPELAPTTYQSTDLKTQEPKIWTLTETPKSTPLMAVPTITDTPCTEVWTGNEIPEPNSLNSSFTTSSLSDLASCTPSKTPSSQSLTSVSTISLMPGLDNPGSNLTKGTVASPPFSAAESKLNPSASPELQITVSHPSVATSKESTSLSLLPTSSDEVCPSTFGPSASSDLQITVPHQSVATPKESSSLSLLPTSSSELTRAVSTGTHGASSSTESCKTPVAPRNDVVITIEDDDDVEEIMYKREKSQYEEMSTVKDVDKGASGEEMVIRIEHVDNEAPLKQSGAQASPGKVIYTNEKRGTNNVTTGDAVIDMSRDDDNEGPLAVNDNTKDADKPPFTLPRASTGLQKGKSLIGGRKALENRCFIKHLISEQESTGFKNDLNTAISRILGEKKSLDDQNNEKRNVIKHQTKETKYSLAESILRAKSIIMNENVNKESDKRSNRCRQTIKQTLSYPVHPAARTQRNLAKEDAFAREIILPGHAHPRAAVKTEVKRQVPCTDKSINLLASDDSTSYSNTKTVYLNDKDYEKWELIQKDFEDKKAKGVKPGAFVPGLKVVEDFFDFPLPVDEHEKNPQAGCRCYYCEKHKKKSRGRRFFKLPRKLLSFKSKSSSGKQSRAGFESSLTPGFATAGPSTSSAGSDGTKFNAT